MKLITPFTPLNRKSLEMDLIRIVKKNIRLANEIFHDDQRKMYKNHQFALLILNKQYCFWVSYKNNQI